MSTVTKFPRPPEQAPTEAGEEFTRAYAELVDAYNAHDQARQLHEHATHRLREAHDRYIAALEALKD